MPVQPGQLFRKLPQIGELLDRPEFVALERTYSRKLVVEYVRSALDELRRDLSAGRHTESSLEQELSELGSKIEQDLRTAMRTSLRPVINATGVYGFRVLTNGSSSRNGYVEAHECFKSGADWRTD